MSTIRTEVASKALARLDIEKQAILDWIEGDDAPYLKHHPAYINKQAELDRAVRNEERLKEKGKVRK